jgi:hypothetical protein
MMPMPYGGPLPPPRMGESSPPAALDGAAGVGGAGLGACEGVGRDDGVGDVEADFVGVGAEVFGAGGGGGAWPVRADPP